MSAAFPQTPIAICENWPKNISRPETAIVEIGLLIASKMLLSP
jgi:hypothetical protein